MDAPLDPSWLPATTATCCATFIAIVGGLLAARNVAVASDRHAAGERVAVLTGLSTRAETETGERLLDWVNVVAEQWLPSIVRDLVDAPDLSAAELLRRQGAEATADQLEPHVSGWERTVRRMNTRINTMLTAGQVLWPSGWPHAKALLAIDLPHASDEYVAAIAYATRRTDLSDAEQTDTQPGGVERMPELVGGQAMTLRREIVQSRLTEARRIERELTTRLAVAEAELAATNTSQVASKTTIGTMAGFSIAGIGWPLATIAYGLDRVAHSLRWINVGVIAIGIPLVLWLLLRPSPAKAAGKQAGHVAGSGAAGSGAAGSGAAGSGAAGSGAAGAAETGAAAGTGAADPAGPTPQPPEGRGA